MKLNCVETDGEESDCSHNTFVFTCVDISSPTLQSVDVDVELLVTRRQR